MTRQEADPTVEAQEIERILAALKTRPMTRDELEEATGIRINVVCWRVARLLREDLIHVSGYRASERTGRTNEVLRAGAAPTQQLTLVGRFW